MKNALHSTTQHYAAQRSTQMPCENVPETIDYDIIIDDLIERHTYSKLLKMFVDFDKVEKLYEDIVDFCDTFEIPEIPDFYDDEDANEVTHRFALLTDLIHKLMSRVGDKMVAEAFDAIIQNHPVEKRHDIIRDAKNMDLCDDFESFYNYYQIPLISHGTQQDRHFRYEFHDTLIRKLEDMTPAF